LLAQYAYSVIHHPEDSLSLCEVSMKSWSNYSKHTQSQAGDAVLEFAAALPLFLLLISGIVIFAWLFWAQAAADIAAVRALKEGAANRGGELVDPGAGASSFSDSMGFLTGPRTAGLIGEAQVSVQEGRRAVQFGVSGSVNLKFGPLEGAYSFGGGGFGRLWRFWPGPPEGWE
jgi:hypothetical protein